MRFEQHAKASVLGIGDVNPAVGDRIVIQAVPGPDRASKFRPIGTHRNHDVHTLADSAYGKTRAPVEIREEHARRTTAVRRDTNRNRFNRTAVRIFNRYLNFDRTAGDEHRGNRGDHDDREHSQ
jgi:hypothetical protein